MTPAPVAHLPVVDAAALAAFAADATVTLVEFGTAWCGPCRAVQPVLASLAAEYGGQLRVVTVDCDADPALAQRFDARSMPTMVILRAGREVGRLIGARPRSYLAGAIDRAIKGDVAIAGP